MFCPLDFIILYYCICTLKQFILVREPFVHVCVFSIVCRALKLWEWVWIYGNGGTGIANSTAIRHRYRSSSRYLEVIRWFATRWIDSIIFCSNPAWFLQALSRFSLFSISLNSFNEFSFPFLISLFSFRNAFHDALLAKWKS